MTDILRPDTLPTVLALAILIERLWEYFAKPATSQLSTLVDRYGPAALATALCLATGLNVTTLDPIPGMLITGLLIGGGSNLVHDITQR